MITLGKDNFTGITVEMPIRPNGDSAFIAGVSQWGKTTECQKIITQYIREGRKRALIIDTVGEYGGIAWMNWNSRQRWVDYVENLRTIKLSEITFYLEDFTSVKDLAALGFEKTNLRYLFRIINNKRIQERHNNNLDEFEKILGETPQDEDSLEAWEKMTGEKFSTKKFQQSVRAMIDRFQFLRELGVFGEPNDGKKHITDWVAELYKGNIRLDMELEGRENSYKAGAYLGIILQTIRDVLHDDPEEFKKLNLLLMVDEVDIYAPRSLPKNQIIESTVSHQLWFYTTKLRKFNVVTMMACTSTESVSKRIFEGCAMRIIGRVTDGDYAQEAMKLRTDRLTSRNQFLFFDGGTKHVYIPFDSPCAYGRYLDDISLWQWPIIKTENINS